MSFSPSPLYFTNTAPDGSLSVGSCYYPTTGAPQSPVNATVIEELKNPTNSTTVEGILYGLGEQFNGLTDQYEQGAKQIIIIKDALTGGFVMAVIEHVAFCTASAEGGEPQSPPAIWLGIRQMIEIVMSFLIALSIIYMVTGRGNVLTS